MSPPTRFMLADAQPIVRQGLRAILNQLPSACIVAETGDGEDVVKLATRLAVDVILLDTALPNRSSSEILIALGENKLRTRVIMLSADPGEPSVFPLLGDGAAGCLLKSATVAEIHLAIETVLKGYRYLSVELADRLITAYLSRSAATPKTVVRKLEDETPLTSRQREILRLMASGHDNLQISHILEISARTVETHRANVMQKLGLGTAFEVVRYALKRGLISLEDPSE